MTYRRYQRVKVACKAGAITGACMAVSGVGVAVAGGTDTITTGYHRAANAQGQPVGPVVRDTKNVDTPMLDVGLGVMAVGVGLFFGSGAIAGRAEVKWERANLKAQWGDLNGME
jgi:hypothetical protein